VEGLLELGAALDCKDKQGRTPLHFAAANGRTAVVRFLWSKGAEVDAETPGGCDRRMRRWLRACRRHMHCSCEASNPARLAFTKQSNRNRCSSLHRDAFVPHCACTRYRVFCLHAEGRTPLHLAALAGHAEAAALLLQKGGWAEAYDCQDDTPLHLAARSVVKQHWPSGMPAHSAC
jgi:hypothetical protein